RSRASNPAVLSGRALRSGVCALARDRSRCPDQCKSRKHRRLRSHRQWRARLQFDGTVERRRRCVARRAVARSRGGQSRACEGYGGLECARPPKRFCDRRHCGSGCADAKSFRLSEGTAAAARRRSAGHTRGQIRCPRHPTAGRRTITAGAVLILGQREPCDRRPQLCCGRSAIVALLRPGGMALMGRRSHLLSYRFCKPLARDAAVELLVLDQTARRPHLSEGSDKFNIMLSLIADVLAASLEVASSPCRLAPL